MGHHPPLAALLSGFTRKTWRHLQESLLERSLPRGERERCPPALGSPARHRLSPWLPPSRGNVLSQKGAEGWTGCSAALPPLQPWE